MSSVVVVGSLVALLSVPVESSVSLTGSLDPSLVALESTVVDEVAVVLLEVVGCVVELELEVGLDDEPVSLLEPEVVGIDELLDEFEVLDVEVDVGFDVEFEVEVSVVPSVLGPGNEGRCEAPSSLHPIQHDANPATKTAVRRARPSPNENEAP